MDSQGSSTGQAIDFWTKFAQLYQNESHVLYEIANEPNNVNWNTVLDYHNSVISAIRAIDTETIIIAGTTTWSQDIHLAASTPVDQPYNVMYTFHFYAASHEALYDRVASYINSIPIFVSEWGYSSADGGGSYDMDVSQQFLDLFSDTSSTILSWVMWNWSDKSETSAILEPSSCGSEAWTDVTCPSKYVENYMKSEDFDAVLTCNSTWYSTSGGDEAFVEEHQWIFYVLGVFVLIGVGVLVYYYIGQTSMSSARRTESSFNVKSSRTSFKQVSKENPPDESDEAPFKYEMNPYASQVSSSPKANVQSGTKTIAKQKSMETRDVEKGDPKANVQSGTKTIAKQKSMETRDVEKGDNRGEQQSSPKLARRSSRNVSPPRKKSFRAQGISTEHRTGVEVVNRLY